MPDQPSPTPPTTQAVPTAPASAPTPELELNDVLKMPQSERLTRLNDLRLKMSTTGNLTVEECRFGMRLIAAERIFRAGSKGGSKEKAEAAKGSFKPLSVADL